ncbi:MAG: c-type cytochrome domain-containing protein, partial [Actinomycetota bacterium]
MQRNFLTYHLNAALCAFSVVSSARSAPARVLFSREVLPILNRECLSCHRGSAAPGGYSLESAKQLLGGGRHGTAVVPGKSGQSSLVRYLTGELKPQMPPGKPLPLDSVALIRRWIDEGARIDSMAAPAEAMGVMRGAMPMKGASRAAAPRHASPETRLLPASVSQSAPVTALAYSPDGKQLAAGGYRAVRLLDPQSGTVLHTLSGPFDQVTA